jgi:hypothetical protein
MTGVHRDAVVAGVILAAMLWIGADHPGSGPVIAVLNRNHGVHLSDPFVLAAPLLVSRMLLRFADRPPRSTVQR